MLCFVIHILIEIQLFIIFVLYFRYESREKQKGTKLYSVNPAKANHSRSSQAVTRRSKRMAAVAVCVCLFH